MNPESDSPSSTAPPSLAARSVIRLRVRFGETDLMGIVHHASYATYMEVARVEWLRRRGVTYATWAEHGIHLPVAELTVRYRAPAHFDEQLAIETTLGQLGAASLRFDYRIVRASNSLLCAEGFTRLACVNGQHAVRRFSAEMLAALEKSEGSTPSLTSQSAPLHHGASAEQQRNHCEYQKDDEQ